MDLTTLRLEVRERIGEVGTADFFSNDEVDRAINEALRRFSSEEHWPWLYTEFSDTLTTDSDELVLPADVSLNRTFNLSLTGDLVQFPYVLERLEPKSGFRARFQNSGRTSRPRWYYISRTNLNDDDHPPVTYTARLIPTPDQDYDVEAQYLMVPPILSGDSDEPACPEEYQEAIVAWAAGKLFLKELQISAKANEQFGVYQKVLEQARKDTLSIHQDEKVAWGRETPIYGFRRTQRDDVMGRIPPAGLGQ